MFKNFISKFSKKSEPTDTEPSTQIPQDPIIISKILHQTLLNNIRTNIQTAVPNKIENKNILWSFREKLTLNNLIQICEVYNEHNQPLHINIFNSIDSQGTLLNLIQLQDQGDYQQISEKQIQDLKNTYSDCKIYKIGQNQQQLSPTYPLGIDIIDAWSYSQDECIKRNGKYQDSQFSIKSIDELKIIIAKNPSNQFAFQCLVEKYKSKNDLSLILKFLNEQILQDNQEQRYQAMLSKVYSVVSTCSKQLKPILKQFKKQQQYQLTCFLCEAPLLAANPKETISLLEQAFQQNQKNYELALAIAKQYYGIQIYDNALAFCDYALKVTNNNLQGLCLKGRCQISLMQLEEGLKTYNTIIEIDPFFDGIHKLKAQALCLQEGEGYLQGLKEYEIALQQNPKDLSIHFLMGETLSKHCHFEEALEVYEKIIKKDNKTIDSYIQKAKCLIQLQKYSESIEVVVMALKLDSNSIEALVLKGRALVENQSPGIGLSVLEEAFKLDPKNVDIFLYTGMAHIQLENFEESIRFFQLAIDIDQNNIEAYMQMANAHLHLEQYEQTVAIYDHVLTIDGRYPHALRSKAALLTMIQEYNDALELLNRALEINSEDIVSLHSKSKIFVELEKYEETFEYINTALKVNPKDIPCLKLKAQILSDLQRRNEEISVLDKILEQNPNDYEALNNKANALLSLEQFDEAIELSDMAIKIDPNEPSSYFNKGMALSKHLKNYQAAIEQFDKVLSLDPSYIEAFYQKSVILNDMGENQKNDLYTWQ